MLCLRFPLCGDIRTLLAHTGTGGIPFLCVGGVKGISGSHANFHTGLFYQPFMQADILAMFIDNRECRERLLESQQVNQFGVQLLITQLGGYNRSKRKLKLYPAL